MRASDRLCGVVRDVPPHPYPHPQAFHEGGVAGVVEGLAPKERRLPPLECLRVWVCLGWRRAKTKGQRRGHT